MIWVTGRTDDMLVIKGVNLYPSQLRAALLTVTDLAPHYQLVVDRNQGFPSIEVRGLNPHVTIVPPKTIPSSEGKAVRVVERSAA